MSHPMTPLLKCIRAFHVSAHLSEISAILEIFKNSDFMDITAVLRSPGMVHDYVRKCEKLEEMGRQKENKIMEKEATIKNLEEEKKELNKRRRGAMAQMAAMRGLIQKELEANFKARFLIVN